MKKIFSLLLVFLLMIVSSKSHITLASAENSTAVKIPVMLYHVVKPNPDPNNPYQYPLAEFEKEMAYLKENGYRTLTMKQYFNILDKKAAMPEKPILLTFDDNSSDF
ncbi:hypothetical protein ACIFOT_04070 [Neobacillus sp. NRS-1170]|uniref:hypothetical protein n=1 Tax=Neobacillus sp. NRS-1170 TaxID=3233898 RepID=UPI003D2C1BB6